MNTTNDLHQVGEYYLRCIGYSGDFPTGAEVSFGGYDWLKNDPEAIKFFEKCRDEYGFRYISETEISPDAAYNQEDIPNNYKRKLTVTNSSGNILMCFVVKEKINCDSDGNFLIRKGKPESSFEILEWSITDSTGHLNPVETTGLFKRVWENIEDTISKVSVKPTEYKITLSTGGQTDIEDEIYVVRRGDKFTLPEDTSITKKAGAHFES